VLVWHSVRLFLTTNRDENFLPVANFEHSEVISVDLFSFCFSYVCDETTTKLRVEARLTAWINAMADVAEIRAGIHITI